MSFGEVIGEINRFVRGWVAYFRYAECKTHLKELDEWLRHKLRCVRLKQRKRAVSIATLLQQLGVPKNRSWTTAACGKGWWRMAQTPAAQQAMSNHWLQAQGLASLLDRFLGLQH